MNDALVSWTLLIGSITIWFFFSLTSILHATLHGGMTYFAILGAATNNGPQGVGANDERIYYGSDLSTIAKYMSLAVFVIVLVWKDREAKFDEQKLPPLPPSSPDKTRIETVNTTWNTNHTSNNAREDPFSNHNGHNNGGVEDNNNPRITLRWDDMRGFILKRATIAQRKVKRWSLLDKRWSYFDSFDEDEVVNAVNNGVNNSEERETVSMKMGDIHIDSVTLNDPIRASLVERVNCIAMRMMGRDVDE